MNVEFGIESEQTIRVLLVEDSQHVRRRVRSLIEEGGPVKIVGEAATTTHARKLFLEHRPEVVVLDLQLEDGTSYAVLREIKQTHPACVVIVLTNFAIPECRESCRALGANFFFDKAKEFEQVPEVLGEMRRAKRGPVE
jgi:DNA-binding NarL/FixJ family response regulator